MLEQIFLNPLLEAHSEQEKIIFVASNGQGYIVNDELHICGNYHFVYKFSGDPVGWYMRNPKDNKDRYLGVGACPSVLIEGLDIKDEAYFNSINYTQSEDEEMSEE